MICDAFFLQIFPNLHYLYPLLDYFSYLTISVTINQKVLGSDLASA